MQSHKPVNEQLAAPPDSAVRVDLSNRDVRVTSAGGSFNSHSSLRSVSTVLEFRGKDGDWIVATGITAVTVRINPGADLYEIVVWAYTHKTNLPKDWITVPVIDSPIKV